MTIREVNTILASRGPAQKQEVSIDDGRKAAASAQARIAEARKQWTDIWRAYNRVEIVGVRIGGFGELLKELDSKLTKVGSDLDAISHTYSRLAIP